MNPVICYLTRNDEKTVKQLLCSLTLLEKNWPLTQLGIPKVIFHEHGFKHEYKRLIQKKFHVRFIEIELKPQISIIPEFEDKLNYSIGYRNMCQFFHSEFYKYLDGYDWFMRLDTDSYIIDKIQYNLFQYLETNNKVYGYIAEIPEWDLSSKNLDVWFESFTEELGIKTEFYKEIIKDGKFTYKHFYNNFEIINRKYFEDPTVDYIIDKVNKSGNIYRWRWGDHIVRTLILSLCYKKDQIHRFQDIGYHHGWFHQKNGKRTTKLGSEMGEMFYLWEKTNDWLIK
jgi:alpha 1,2-mannosyltransferase